MLLRPDSPCPNCGELPRIGMRLDVVELVAKWPDDRLVMTYQCHRDRNGSRCNTIHGVTAGAIRSGRRFGG